MTSCTCGSPLPGKLLLPLPLPVFRALSMTVLRSRLLVDAPHTSDGRFSLTHTTPASDTQKLSPGFHQPGLTCEVVVPCVSWRQIGPEWRNSLLLRRWDSEKV